MEEVREPSVRQGCLKSPRSPQITLRPCFYFSPTCNKSAQAFGFFFCFFPCSSPDTGIPQPPPGLCAVWTPSPGTCMSLSPLLLPSARPFLALLLARAPLSVGASQHVPLHGRLLPHRPLCYPAVEAAGAALLSLPLSLPSGNTFSGTACPLSFSLPGPQECLQFFFAL